MRVVTHHSDVSYIVTYENHQLTHTVVGKDMCVGMSERERTAWILDSMMHSLLLWFLEPNRPLQSPRENSSGVSGSGWG
jgi:hypothetical protein